MERETRRRPAPRGQRFSQAERLQDFETSGLDAQRTRLAGTIRLFVDDAEADTESYKLRGQCQPRWSSAHHQHVPPEASGVDELMAIRYTAPSRVIMLCPRARDYETTGCGAA